MMVKRIVVLAIYRMPGGRCIAGKEVFEDGRVGGWVRLVNDDGGGVPLPVVSDLPGGELRSLDVVEVAVWRPQPIGHHTENWVANISRPWRRVGRWKFRWLPRLVDGGGLWVNGHSSYFGHNNRVSVHASGGIVDSLRLVPLDYLALATRGPGPRDEDFPGDPKVDGDFGHRDEHYRMAVTDADLWASLSGIPDGTREVRYCFATVSLGLPLNDYLYKTLAGVIH